MTIVATASVSDRMTPEGDDRVRVKLSSGSNFVSPRTLTAMVFLNSPGANTSVPDAGS